MEDRYCLLGFHEIDSFVYLSSLVDSTSEKCEREGVYVGQGTGSLFLPLCTGTVAAEPLQLGMATSRVVSWPSKCQLICEWNVAVRSDCIPALWPWTVSAFNSSIYCVQMRWVTQGFESTLYEKILWDFGNSQDLAWSWILKCLVLFPILGFGDNRENFPIISSNDIQTFSFKMFYFHAWPVSQLQAVLLVKCCVVLSQNSNPGKEGTLD